MDWRGRRVWIVGASSGIGAALARALGAKGARLVLSSRDEARLREVAAASGDAVALPLDLARPDTLEGAADAAWSALGALDVVVLNAGVAHRDLAERTAMAVDRRLMEVDYFGPVALAKAVLPRFLAAGAGHFVVTSSLSGKYGVPRTSAYAAAKHALHGFFDSLRAEVADRGVTVTLVVPGFVATEITRKALEGDGEPHGRMLRVQAEGMSPEACADLMIRAMALRASEVTLGATASASVLVSRLLPRVWMWIIRNHPIRRLRALSWRARPPELPLSGTAEESR